MGLPTHKRNDIVLYRIDKSYVTLQEAKDNAKLNHWSLAANRLYYSVFYMSLALLLKKNIVAKSHTGVFGMISKEFISSGILRQEEGMLYRQLFTMRQSGDYDDLFDWGEQDILPIFPKVEALLEKMRSLMD